MTSDKPDMVHKWRRPVATPHTTTAAAFAELVLEHGLRVIGPDSDGYKYAALETDDGYDVYRVPDVDWGKIAPAYGASADPAAGAANVTVYTCPAAKVAKFLSCSEVYVRDANAANVYAVLQHQTSGGGVMGTWVIPTALTASVSWNISFSAGSASQAASTYAIAGLASEGICMKATDKIVLTWVSKQATDDGGVVVFNYKEAPA